MKMKQYFERAIEKYPKDISPYTDMFNYCKNTAKDYPEKGMIGTMSYGKR